MSDWLSRAGMIGSLSLAMSTGLAAAEPGRYSMLPSDGGFIRLDTLTGAMSTCTKSGADWACADMAETAEASRKRLSELEAENKSLKDEIKRMEETIGLGTSPGQPGDALPKNFTMPDEKDVDQAFDYLEKMVKKFRERMKRLEKEQEGDGTPL